jgi:hypothetical protein
MDALGRPNAANALRELDEAGELTQALPELESGRGFEQPELHFYDVLDHNLAAVAAFDAVVAGGKDTVELHQSLSWLDINESLEREIGGVSLRTLTRLACLVHDVAKPATAIFTEGRLRFPRHGPRGSDLMRARLPELGFEAESTDLVARLVRYHLRPRELVRPWPPSDHAVRRFASDLDGHVLPLLLVNLCDGMATRGPGYTRENFRRHCSFASYVLARSISAFDEPESPFLHGDDLMSELGMESGRTMGAVLTSVRRAQLEGAVWDRGSALALARSILAELAPEGSQAPG